MISATNVPDLILHRGLFTTLDRSNPTANAVAVKNGKFTAVGRSEDILPLEHFSIRLGVSRVCEISVAFLFGNTFEKRGDCSPKLLNCARLHLA